MERQLDKGQSVFERSFNSFRRPNYSMLINEKISDSFDHLQKYGAFNEITVIFTLKLFTQFTG